MATHSSILAWKIPWTEEPGGLQSMGSHRVRHDWSHFTHTYHAEMDGADGCMTTWRSFLPLSRTLKNKVVNFMLCVFGHSLIIFFNLKKKKPILWHSAQVISVSATSLYFPGRKPSFYGRVSPSDRRWGNQPPREAQELPQKSFPGNHLQASGGEEHPWLPALQSLPPTHVRVAGHHLAAATASTWSFPRVSFREVLHRSGKPGWTAGHRPFLRPPDACSFLSSQ